MTRQFAQIQTRIWIDDEWKALSVEAQHLYALLLSQDDMGASGLIPLRPRRWGKLSANGSVDKIMSALAELDDASFVVVDTETSEVLLRTFLRNAEGYKLVRVLRIALDQATRAESPRIRSALGQELALLPKVAVPTPTDRNARAVMEARAAQQQLDEVVSMLLDAPPDPGHGMASWDDAKGWGHGCIPVPLPVPVVGSCSSRDQKSLEGDHGRATNVLNGRWPA